jgi:hypothetical protein
MSEYDFEPVRGLPKLLPAGEQMLWQGAPQWRVLARRAFHTRKAAVYFAALLGWRVFSAIADGHTVGEALLAALWLLPLALAALGLLLGLAWGYSRSTVYTITDQRVVMRFGIALPMTVNIPFRVIDSASLKAYPDGSGDLPLQLRGKDRIAYLALWPNTRPWHFARPQPMLRALPQAAAVAELLAQALADSGTGLASEIRVRAAPPKTRQTTTPASQQGQPRSPASAAAA